MEDMANICVEFWSEFYIGFVSCSFFRVKIFNFYNMYFAANCYAMKQFKELASNIGTNIGVNLARTLKELHIKAEALKT